MTGPSEEKPVAVLYSNEAKQTGETHPTEWDWVERSVWTERMLEALERGVKGGVWFSLIDNQRWPNQYFRVLGLFCLDDAHRALLKSS